MQEPDRPLTKRRRVALACNACRTRKSKCDGRRPVCVKCEALGFECEYEPSDSSTNVIVQKEYLSSLEDRLKHAEQRLQRHDDLLMGHLSACTGQAVNLEQPPGASETRYAADGFRLDASGLGDPATERPLEAPENRHAAEGFRLDASGLAEDPAMDDERTDGFAITFVNERASAFYGESSNVGFSRSLLRAISVTWTVDELERLAATGGEQPVESRDMNPSQGILPIEPFDSPGFIASILPKTEVMEDLLDIYFATTGSLFPFIHEPTFRETFSEFKKSGFTKVCRTWLGLLNMTFAMASNFNIGNLVSTKERHKRSQIYYARAEALCSAPFRRSISLEIVQYLLLVVLYLQGAQRSTQTWSVHGILVRTATALGLHSESSGRRLDQVRQETRRRTWLTIFCLDKVLSVSFGRPSSILEEHLTVQPPAPWPITESSQSGRMIGKDHSEFLAISVELYKIMGRSLKTQYNSNLGQVDENVDVITTIKYVGEVRQDLRRWVLALPPHLTMCQPGSFLESSPQNRSQVILTLRYHNLNILVHRPLLDIALQFLSKPEVCSDNAPHTIQLAVAEARDGIASAQSTIDIVHSVLTADSTGHNNLGIWFFTLYYVFAASLVICGRNLWVQRGSSAELEDFTNSGQTYLQKAAEALECLDRDILLVQNCAKYVRYLSGLQHAQLQPRFGETSAQTDQASPFFDARDFAGSDTVAGQFFGFDVFDTSIFDALPPYIGDRG